MKIRERYLETVQDKIDRFRIDNLKKLSKQ
jgi:hypothetical protein